MTLENAYLIGKKYGFTFNGIGPSLSLIDNKIGICLKLLDEDFGYLTRNYCFDNEKDLESFLKKYSYYIHNKDELNLSLKLKDYKSANPEIIYSFDKEEEIKSTIEYENMQLLIEDIKSYIKSFVEDVNTIKNDMAEKVLIEQDYYNKFNYYNKVMYKAYDNEYDEEIKEASKDDLLKISKQIKDFDLKNNRKLSKFNLKTSKLDDLNKIYNDIYKESKEIVLNEEVIKILYDKLKFQNNILTLDQMIDYFVKNPVADDNTENALNEIKEKNKDMVSYEDFKANYLSKYDTKYNLKEEKDYNQVIFKAKPLELKSYVPEAKPIIKRIKELEDIYNSSSEDIKRSYDLLFSPLKDLLLYIIKQAFDKNKDLNFDVEEYKELYEDLKKCMLRKDNLVFKVKYFKSIKMEDYDSFIKSVVKIAKKICSSYSNLPFDIRLYTINVNDCMISASDSVIKNGDDSILILDSKKDCSYLYSPIKLKYSKKDYTISEKINDNVIYIPSYLNEINKDENKIELNVYNEGYSVMNVSGDNLLIVNSFSLDKTVNYSFAKMVPKAKK